MKILFLAVAFLLVANMGLFADVGIEDSDFPQIQFSFDQDGRKWKTGNNAKNEQLSITEWVLENEDVEKWTEIVTTQYFKGVQMGLEEFVDTFIKQLQNTVPNDRVHSRIISTGPNNILIEWWLQNGNANDQHEWAQIFKEGNTIAILRYTTKNADKVATIGKKWEKILSEAKLQAPLPK